MINKLTNILVALKKDEKGQDLIEYALMAGFVAVAAGAVLPNISTQISAIFTAINGLLTNAAAGGGAS
jgi:pilus assembly protein Flp/PilA